MESGGKDILSRLKGRFRSLPIHKRCYHASTTDASRLARRLEATSAEEKNQKDDYGMTPFHIISTSAKLRSDLLEVLLDGYPLETLAHKDANGKTMMDYLFVNRSSKALPLIKLLIQKVIVEQMSHNGLEKWQPELSSLAASLDWNGEIDVRRPCLDRVLARLGFCVKMEVPFLLELALWKRNIMPSANGSKSRKRKKRRKVDRENCRMFSGAEVVIPSVIAFLWNANAAESEDISMVPANLSWMRD
mmetsp:Transcript_31454/g.75906  ORF Transcript_31454/g.75906 Transcript_31454/m.75906 type:complete len:247 (+) Transcript_31454:862-1602(+)